MRGFAHIQAVFLCAAVLAFAAAWFSIRTYYSRYYAVAAKHGVMSPQEHTRRLERSLAYDPEYGYGYLLLAESLMRRGRLEEALHAQLHGMKSYRTVPALLQLGTILERMRRAPEAREVYEKAVTVAPVQIPALERLAVIAYSNGETTRARELADKIARVDLNNPNPLYLRALLAERAGNLPLAYRYYQRISAAGPPAGKALYQLQDIRSRLETLRPQVEKR